MLTDNLVIIILGISIFALFFSWVSMFRASRVETTINNIHHEVKTMNELTIGQLGEAEETRRILSKPEEDRTTREKRHTDASQERSTGA